MIYVFNNATPVLNYGPNCKPHKPRSQQYLLWPAYAYRVVAPERRHRQLNLFQKHVLGLCRSGVYKANSISDLLDIDMELAAFLLVELKQMGLLNDEFMPSENGLRVLDEESSGQDTMMVGFVFQDPWSGKFWPRFVSQLAYIDVEYQHQRAYLLLGTTGNPRRKRAFCWFPRGDTLCYQPKPQDILKASRLHRRHARDYKRYMGKLDEIDSDNDIVSFEPESNLQQVALINEEPVPVMLTTFVYVPKSITEGISWQVCDPFGLGINRELRTVIEEQMEHYEPLKHFVRQLTDKIVSEEDETFLETNAQMLTKATEVVEDQLTLAIRRYPSLYEDLIGMEIAHSRVNIGGPNLKNDIKDILTKSQIVLEGLFGVIRSSSPTEGCWRILTREDVNHNSDLVNQIAAKIGFTLNHEDQLPPGLTRISLGKIKSAADFGGESIGPRLVASLLTAHRRPDHPFHRAARLFPEMLIKVYEIAQLRNQFGAHAGTVRIGPQEIEEVVKSVYCTTRSLLLKSRGSNKKS